MKRNFFTLLLAFAVVFGAMAQDYSGLKNSSKNYVPNQYNGADAYEVSWAGQFSKDAYTYTPGDSPAVDAYSSDTYGELGWTDITVVETGTVGVVEIDYTWATDSWAYEGAFILESPAGTQVIVGDGEDAGTYSKVMDQFSGEALDGDWKLYITDSYGDGGHQATGITVVFNTQLGDDLGVSAISPSFVMYGDDATPMAYVKNFGANTQDDFSVELTINDGTTDVYTSTKSVTAAGLNLGETYTVTMDDVWTMPAVGTYSITAVVTLAGDEEPGNDAGYITSYVVEFNYEAGYSYGYDAYGSFEGQVTKNSIETGVLEGVGTPGTSEFLSGGDFVDGILVAVEYETTNVYVVNGDGNAYPYGQVPVESPTGLAYDETTGTVFVGYVNGDIYSTTDFENYTLVGNCSSTNLIGIACNGDGTLYGVDIDDNFIQIDKATGAGTVIGPVGIDLQYAQDIGADKLNNKIYGTLYSASGGWYEIDVTTGAATLINDFGSEVTLCAVNGVETYTVTFSVDDGTDPIEGAMVEINGEMLYTDATGMASIMLAAGDYAYDISNGPFCDTYSGTVTVVDMAIDMPAVSLTCEVPTAEVTFKVMSNDPAYTGFELKGSWDVDGNYDATWNGGAVLSVFYNDGTNGDEVADDDTWTVVQTLVADAGANTWEWGVSDQDGNWIDGNWTFEVVDGTAQELVFDMLVSVNELNNNVSVYPNPSNGAFTVEANGTYNMQVIDLTGKVVLEKEITNTDNVEINQAGVYMLRLTNDVETINYKVVVE